MISPEQIQSLLSAASTVANETEVAANTANRIGTLFARIINALGNGATEEDIKNIIRNFGAGLFLSKISEDTAKEVITFLKGLKIGAWNEGGITGAGGYIDDKANATLNTLTLRSWLEVPEIRYNRVELYVGTRWQTPGGGIVENVTASGTGGAVTLKLEKGEIGAVAVDDLNMGIWHGSSGNAAEDTDDRKGNFSFAGFQTIYFRITAIPDTDTDGRDNSDKHFFEYTLRSQAEGGNGLHPAAGMHFSCRGNPTNTDRQAFRYETTRYTLRLARVTTWEFQPSNIVYIEGLLDGFAMPAVTRNADGELVTYLKEFSGEGQVFGNAYMYGSLDQFERVADYMEFTLANGGRIAPGETEMVAIAIINGYGLDVTSEYSSFYIQRDSGNPTGDAAWNATHTDIESVFHLSFDDLGIGGLMQRVMFTVTATKNDGGKTTGSFAVSAEGQAQLHIEFELSRTVVYVDNVDVVAEARLYYGDSDVTEQFLLKDSTAMSWKRDSGVSSEDLAWIPTLGAKRNILLIKHGEGYDRNDCGSLWTETLTCSFAFTAVLSVDYNDTITVSDTLNIGN